MKMLPCAKENNIRWIIEPQHNKQLSTYTYARYFYRLRGTDDMCIDLDTALISNCEQDIEHEDFFTQSGTLAFWNHFRGKGVTRVQHLDWVPAEVIFENILRLCTISFT